MCKLLSHSHCVSVLLSMVMFTLPKWFRRERTPIMCCLCYTLFVQEQGHLHYKKEKKRKKATVAWPLAANDNNQWWLVGPSVLDFKPWEEAWITTCVLFYITLEHRDAIHILHLIQTLHWIFQSLITGWWLSPWARVFKICTYLYLKVKTHELFNRNKSASFNENFRKGIWTKWLTVPALVYYVSCFFSHKCDNCSQGRLIPFMVAHFAMTNLKRVRYIHVICRYF